MTILYGDDPPDPHSTGAELMLAMRPLVSVSGMLTCVRLWAKLQPGRSLWYDDYMLVAAWLFVTIQGIVLAAAVSVGYGHYNEWLRFHRTQLERTHIAAITNVLAPCLYVLSAGFSKGAFVFSLQRIASDSKWMTQVSRFVLCNVVCIMGLSILMITTLCTDPEKAWIPFVAGDKCLSVEIFVPGAIGASVFASILELIMALMPWQIVRGLQMKWREKAGVAATMSMGIIAAVAGIIKCHWIVVYYGPNADYSHDVVAVAFWQTAEATFTIMAACMPIVRVIVRDVSRHVISGSHSKVKTKKNRSNYQSNRTVVNGGARSVVGESVKVQVPASPPPASGSSSSLGTKSGAGLTSIRECVE